MGVLRWLNLKSNETIIFEGDEDIDRLLLHGNIGVSEQLKDLTGAIDVRHESIRTTLANFLLSYTALRQRDEIRRFVFTTTASFQRGLRSSQIDLFADWCDPTKRLALVPVVRDLVLSADQRKKSRKRSPGLSIADAIAWLDTEPERWVGFLKSVEWHDDQPGVETVLQQITDELASRPETRDLASELLAFRLLGEVLLASSQKDPTKRSRTRRDLKTFISKVRDDLAGWGTSPMARNLRAVFHESMELARILRDVTLDPVPEYVRRSPGKLLTAYYEAIPFDTESRRDELAQLTAWCEGGDLRSVWLLHGEGGTGKTRLLIEWCRRLTHNGWHAGFLDTRSNQNVPDMVARLLQGLAPRLIVIDYAEQSPGVARSLIDQLAHHRVGPKVRLALLTRRIPDWWIKFRLQSDALDDLVEQSPAPFRISSLVPTEPDRRLAVQSAAAEFAAILGKKPPFTDLNIDLSHPLFDRALYLHMVALASVFGDTVERLRDPLQRALDHERRFWTREIEALDLKEYERTALETSIGPAIAATTLLGEVSLTCDGKAFFATVVGAAITPYDLTPQLLWLLQRLCGNGNDSVGGLEPDLLGERLIEVTLGEDPLFLTRTFEALPREEAILRFMEKLMSVLLRRGTNAEPSLEYQLEQSLHWLEVGHRGPTDVDHGVYSALTFLTRLAQRRSQDRSRLETALAGRLESVALAAMEVAVETGNPIGMILAEKIEHDYSSGLAESLIGYFDGPRYRQSLALREVALAVTKRTLEDRERRRDTADAGIAEIARLKSNLCFCLSLLGRQEQASQLAHEAVRLYRHLPQERLDHRYELAVSLTNLGSVAIAIGDREGALKATREAIQILRALEEARPAVLPDLARSFINLGSMLFSSSAREEALESTQRGVEILQQLAEKGLGVFRAELARGLSNLGSIFRSLGRFDDAAEAASVSLGIRRELVEIDPGAFYSDLAASLKGIAGVFRNREDRRGEALVLIQEAVGIWRRIAGEVPDAALPELADSLEELAATLLALGERGPALQAVSESIEILRHLQAQRPRETAARVRLLLDRVTTVLQDLDSSGYEAEEVDSLANVVRSVAAFFVQQPLAFADPMNTSLSIYLRALIAAEKEADREILKPLLHAIEKTLLEANDSPI